MKKLTRGAVMAISLLAGFSAVTAAVVAVGGSAVPYETNGQAAPHTGRPNSVNMNGQTYGTAGDKLYDEDIPDLIAVIGDHGIQGYVTKEDYMDDDGVTCPEEAVAYMEAKARGEIPDQVWTVYEADGITPVDTFTVGNR